MTERPGDSTAEAQQFRGVFTEISDGIRSSLAQSSGWSAFAERLGTLISALPTRRRQALVMLLFALTQRMVAPDQADEWLNEHEVDRDEDVEALIGWLRHFDPPSV